MLDIPTQTNDHDTHQPPTPTIAHRWAVTFNRIRPHQHRATTPDANPYEKERQGPG